MVASKCGFTSASNSTKRSANCCVDAVVGTSLLQALSGDRLGKYAKSSFLVQRVGGAVCFQHLPIRAANILNQPGHQLEEICSPRRKGSVAHYSVGRLKIDDLTVLCVSEIDASENGAPVDTFDHSW